MKGSESRRIGSRLSMIREPDHLRQSSVYKLTGL